MLIMLSFPSGLSIRVGHRWESGITIMLDARVCLKKVLHQRGDINSEYRGMEEELRGNEIGCVPIPSSRSEGAAKDLGYKECE